MILSVTDPSLRAELSFDSAKLWSELQLVFIDSYTYRLYRQDQSQSIHEKVHKW